MREELFKFLRKVYHHLNKVEVLSYYRTAEDVDDGSAYVPPEWPRAVTKIILNRWPEYVCETETRHDPERTVRGMELIRISGEKYGT